MHGGVSECGREGGRVGPRWAESYGARGARDSVGVRGQARGELVGGSEGAKWSEGDGEGGRGARTGWMEGERKGGRGERVGGMAWCSSGD